MKEIFLSDHASRSLQALHLLQAAPDGLLIGHKKGGKFHVEDILPTLEGFFRSQEDLPALYELYDERIIGFFSSRKKKESLANILTPACYGKLFLHIQSEEDGSLSFSVNVIEYDSDFFLRPLSSSSHQRIKRG